ncbi:MAG: flagellar basal body-associated FliL family protein [bacterium]
MESAIQEVPLEAAPDIVASRSKLPLLLIVTAGLLVGGIVGVFVTGPIATAKVRARSATAAAAPKDAHGKAAGGDQKVLRIVDNLVLNPAGSGGTRFLMVTATLELSDAAADEALKARDAEVRDALLGYFGRKTVAELTDMSGREQIKKDLIELLKPLVTKGAVTAVYFPQFVIQ